MKQPPDVIRQLLSYDPLTGSLTWKVRPRSFFLSDRDCGWWNGRFAGKATALRINRRGYRVVKILDLTHQAHRVAWAIAHGEYPSGGEIDHINGNGADNRLENLRAVTRSENAKNVRLSRNVTGRIGVQHHRKGYRARITHNGKRINLGFFDTIEAAAEARAIAERQFGYHENHGR